MTTIMLGALVALGVMASATAEAKNSVAIVVDQNATRVGNTAATELGAYLAKLYPSFSFPVTHTPVSDKTIILRVDPSGKDLPETPEGHVVSADENQAVIRSKGEAGLLQGVYGLLEHLGVGFYLSEEILPAPAKEFSFKGW